MILRVWREFYGGLGCLMVLCFCVSCSSTGFVSWVCVGFGMRYIVHALGCGFVSVV